MTRNELLTAMKAARAEMDAALTGLTDEQLVEPGVLGEWTMKDLLAHLTAWEVELVTALGQLQRGQRPRPMPSDDETDRLNATWHAEQQSRPLERVLADFRAVRTQSLRQVERLTDAELHEPRAWLKGESLEMIVTVETFEHEAEHLPHIREWRKQKGY
jgi:uncharacterized protein (TIGR03083 family)